MIVVGGENLIDLVQITDREGLPAFRAVPGGSQYNCARALGRLGLRPHYITPISSDKMGDLLAATLTQSGGTVASARLPVPSSLALVTLDAGQPAYQFYREGTAERAVTLESLRSCLPSQTRLFQLGSLSLCDGEDAQAWAEFFVELADKGIACCLDPNVRPAFVQDRRAYIARLEHLISVARLVKVSDEDLAWLYPGTDIEHKVQALAAQSKAALFVLTKGAEGARLIARQATASVEAIQVTEVQDTVGAGDTFMAALIYQLLQNPDLGSRAELERLGRFCAKAAAINCRRTGCNPPTLDEIEAY